MTSHPEVPRVDPSTERMLSIWFFVGVLMLSCGLLILGQGIYEFSHPGTTVLADLHPAASTRCGSGPVKDKDLTPIYTDDTD
jgi:hypothetical protein